MSKPITGKITTSTWKQKRKNGDIYVWERKTQYVPETRKTKELSRRLLGKIPAGSTTGEMVPTRPERKTTPRPIGISKLLSWIGKESGITEDLLASTDTKTAQKIETLVQFTLFNQHEWLSEIENWQIFYPTPYKETINAEVCTELFTQLSEEKDLEQKYFQARAKRFQINSPTVYEFCNDIGNNDNNETNTVFLTFWDIHNHLPFAFNRQPKKFSNPPNIGKAFKQMGLGGKYKADELVTDAPFFNDGNLPNMVRKNVKFLTNTNLDFPWVHKALEENREKIISNQCPWNKNFYGYSVPIDPELIFTNNGQTKSKKTNKPQQLFLHLFWDRESFEEEEQRFKDVLFEYEMMVKEAEYVELPEFMQREIEKYFNIYLLGDVDDEEAEAEFDVELKEDVYAKKIEDYGYFALISSSTDDCFAALEKFRFQYEFEDLIVDTSTWTSSDCSDLRGVTFCQFILIGYYCFLYQKIKNLKESLQKDIQNTQLNEKSRKEREDLFNWLNGEKLPKILEQIELTGLPFLKARNPIKTPSEKEIKRENLLFRLLGVPS